MDFLLPTYLVNIVIGSNIILFLLTIYLLFINRKINQLDKLLLFFLTIILPILGGLITIIILIRKVKNRI